MHPDWARSLRDQCVAASVPYLFKQWGEWGSPARAMRIDLLKKGLVRDLGGGWYQQREGKRSAGRKLDGREWDQYPEADRGVGTC